MESEIYTPYLIKKLNECRETQSPELNLFDLHLKEVPKEIGEFFWLTYLKFSFNEIQKIEHLENLTNLKELYFDNNQINEIKGLDRLEKLEKLHLNRNQIVTIEGLENLVNLKELNLSSNKLTRINGVSSFIANLDNLDLSANPIDEIPEDSLSNVMIIEEYLRSQKEDKLVPNRFFKINIIGDGRIGKSQLFHFFEKDGKYQISEQETYGTNTTLYKIPNENYQAFIWDFGGQYYHHGFHQVFIRSRDFNIVLWCNKNSKKHNYSYWLGTARNYSPESPLYLVQNVWEEADYVEDEQFMPHEIQYPESSKLKLYSVGLDSVFAINVKALHKDNHSWKIRHDFFINSLHHAMKQYAQTNNTFQKVSPKWIDIKEVLDKNPMEDLYLNKEMFRQKFANDFFGAYYENLLIYLEFTGNILYFQNNYQLKHYIFLNPPKLSDWIYKEILTPSFKEENNGVLDSNSLKESIGEENYQVFRSLMTSFNLLFTEKDDENNLIIPQFLPEQNATFKHYLLELIPYYFCIRFADFIHEGRIFQFISEYGEFALDNTSYWRYGIVFTKNEVKTMVYYDNISRTIFVHIEQKKGRIEISQEIFDYFIKKEKPIKLGEFAKQINVNVNDIIRAVKNATPKNTKPIELYPNSMISKEYRDIINSNLIHHMRTGNYFVHHWLKDDLEEEHKVYLNNEIKKVHNVTQKINVVDVVEGTQLSTNDGINFFDVKATIEQNIEGLNIGICVDKLQSFKLDYLAINLLGMENHKLPKVFISYSRKDLEFKDELKSHLSILERYDLLNKWSCDDMPSGEWDKQIQAQLEEADIIVYMVSHNFMSSDYIMEKEVKRGLKLVEENPSKKIMCVLVRECMWSQWENMEKKYNEIVGEKAIFSESMDLSQYQFLPYHQYKNNKGTAIKEEIVALEQWGSYPYTSRNVAFKQIASRLLRELR